MKGRLSMATQADFERRRREREKRDRIRKKRARAILIAAAFLILVIIIALVVNSCSKNQSNTETQNYVSEDINTQSGAVASTSTPMPVSGNPEGVKDIPAAEDENDLLPIIKKSPAEKYCYLTFDDGPSEKVTPQILDILRRYNIKATFFQVGSYIEENPDIARRVYEEGHLIAGHSYSHNYDKLYDTEESFMAEVEDTYEAIKSVTGESAPFKLIRFPGGSYNSGDHASEKQIYKETLKEMGYYYVDWNALTGDADGRTRNAQQLLDYFKENKPSGSVVVLMHDASSKQSTADSLSSVIDYLISEGYTFHRLDDIPYDNTDTQPAPSASPSASSSPDTNS